MSKALLVYFALLFWLGAEAQYIQNGSKLFGSGSTGGQWMGYSVALSADSSTLISGAARLISTSYSGGAFIFTRQDTNWIQQAILAPADNAGWAEAGNSVAISADGNTVIIGGPLDNNNRGAAWIYTRNGTTWTEQAKLVDSVLVTATGQQGFSVALSVDGNTAIVGAPQNNDTIGSALVYVRNGATWSEQANLVGSNWVSQPHQGSTVTISYDGNTAALIGCNDSFYKGAAWVFVRNGSTWTQDGNKLSRPFVYSSWNMGIVLSGDGLTLAAGDEEGGGGQGGVHIFKKIAGAWHYSQTAYSLNYSSSVQPSQGEYISLSYDGMAMAFTGPLDNMQYGLEQGHAYIFTRSATDTIYHERFNTYGPVDYLGERHINPIVISANGGMVIFGDAYDREDAGCAAEILYDGSQWGMIHHSIFSLPTAGTARQGCAVAVSADGKTLLTGGLWDDGKGAFWSFKKNGSSWVQHGNKVRGAGVNYVNWFASRLAISADGSYALATGLTSDYLFYFSPIGLYPFIDSAGSFMQDGDSINAVPGEFLWGSFSGGAVALSRDGSTMLMSAVSDSNNRGATWEFSRVGNNWVLQGGRIVGTRGHEQGNTLAISAHGDVAVIGNYIDTANYIFRKTAGVWQQELMMVNKRDYNNDVSVAISDDGLTVALGAPADSTENGVVYMYTYNGTSWSLQAKLRPSDELGKGNFGSAVSLSADGNTLAVGGKNDKKGRSYGFGAFWVFKRSGNTWYQYGSKLAPNDTAGYAEVGSSIAITPDGNTVVVGGQMDMNAAGATWVYDYTGLRVVTDSLNPACVFSPNGKITAHAEGGVGPYHYKWSVNGAADADTIANLSAGFYYLTVYDAGNDSATMLFDVPGPVVTGCDSLTTGATGNSMPKIQIQPNPADALLFVNLSYPGDYELQVYNELGQPLVKKDLKQSDVLNTENLSGGLYFIKVLDKNSGAETGVRKFVVGH